MKKIISIILLLLMFITINVKYIYADDTTIDRVITGGDSFLNAGDTSGTVSNDKIIETSNLIYNILVFAGIAVIFIWGVVLGIKFVTGAMMEKAEVKQELLIYLFGSAIIFIAPTIWKLIINVTKTI